MNTSKNFRNLSFLILFFIGIFTLVSCAKEDSSDVNQDKIWTEYALYYNQNDDVTHAVARFRFGNATGTLLELSDTSSASVTFNGTAMPYSAVWSGHHLQFAGNVTTGTFVYTNTTGTVYSNSVPMGVNTTTSFPANFDTIVKSSANTFTWNGPALAANESIGIFIGSWGWGKDALFYTEADGATNLVMGINSKANLALGTSTVYLNRTYKNTTINGTSKGGSISYTYQPINDTVVVVQ